MELERFDPTTDAGQVRACHEIYLAGAGEDEPHVPPMPYSSFQGWMRYGWTEDPSQAWLARDGAGEPCGWYRLTLPERENRHLADIRPVTHPSRRRSGIGRALVRHAAARADEAGRSLLTGMSRQGSAGEAFAWALGARQGLTEVDRVLRLDSVPAGHLAGLRRQAQSAAAGYTLLTWEGLIPVEEHAAVAEVCAALADAPKEPGQQAQRWDAERVRQSSLRIAAQGLRYYTVAARQKSTGELAALTQLGVDPHNPAWGFQELTAVTRAHRGHRLGCLLKVAMLELLADREPQLRQIMTVNADDNKHMIAINTELGFTVTDYWSAWELEVARVRAVAQVAGTGLSQS